MPICGLGSLECVIDAEQEVAIFEAQNLHKNTNFRCNCLQACNSIQYKLELSRMHYNINSAFDSVYKGKAFYSLMDRASSSIVVAISSRTVYGIKRMKLATITDFLSSCGGILSLFIGFSVFSLFEICHLFWIQWITLVKALLIKIQTRFNR